MEMKRRLVKQGERALTVTIPAAWAKKQHLTAGDEADVFEGDTGLTITTEKKQPIKEIIVDVSGLTPRLADRFIARAYQKGYDKIIIKYDKQELALAIQEKVKELLGFEVMELTKDTIIIQSISPKLDIDFDSSLRRAFLKVIDMSDTCLEAFTKGDNKTLGNLHHKDFDVNKFCYFCLRAINKGQHQGFGTYILYYLIELLEDVGDEYKALAKVLPNVKSKKEIITILAKVNETFKLGYEFFYKPEKPKAVDAIQLYNQTKQDIDNAFGKMK